MVKVGFETFQVQRGRICGLTSNQVELRVQRLPSALHLLKFFAHYQIMFANKAGNKLHTTSLFRVDHFLFPLMAIVIVTG